MPSRDKVVLRAAVLFWCCLLPWVVGMQTVRAQGHFVFSLPSIPDSLTTVDARATHLVAHYWDGAVFPPSLSATDNDSIEQAWVNYCDLFRLADTSVAQASVARLVGDEHLPSASAVFVMSLAEKYLFDTESPYASDTTYISALRAFTARQDVDTLYRLRHASQLRMLTHCCVGSTAADFSFVPTSGIATTLYRFSVPQMLLVIYDPTCDHCRALMDWLSANTHVASLLSSGNFSILSINVGDTNNSTQYDGYSTNWTDARDTYHNIVTDNLYDLRTLPLCLLLDTDKKIVAKTTDIPLLKQAFRSLIK